MRMQITLENHSNWYGDDIKNCFTNDIWMCLDDERYKKSDLKEAVQDAIANEYPFKTQLTFRTVDGSSKCWFILEERKRQTFCC
ncbi:MAG: hypothetical protein P4L69_18905 [Desulfosporosinus sp.]|nr:hypothetical protein [Desulfosporosinus sp.]